ncbi:regulator [Bacillus sp. M6-12]|uniref:intercompartmental signaling factor BofC n=1 Tax=Bacillus sp. M6-12 TaxID=2054166 RepID=UPI000C7922B4|nr:intercompartmental signaling factor BofC [Bacillus sp. M6-12]PLS15635.1 regulator [Bacillus sp. M6-12]
MKRRFSVYVTLLAIMISLSLLAVRLDEGAARDNNGMALSESKTANDKVPSISGPLERKVVLQRMYLDGEISEETIIVKIWAMEDFWAEYKDWQLVDQSEERIIFQRKENDISPLLKANGYFGLSSDGTLSIFNGRPDQSKIIQSFFQIDVGKLESFKRQELLEGIRIENKNKYEQVIESFKHYSASGKTQSQ